jgi:hypothetical protein
MLKCPFCNYQNEDGALFCEQCKSDLASATATPAAAAPDPAAPAMAEAVPMATVIEEAIPMAAIDTGAVAAPIAVAVAAAPPAAPMAVETAAAPPLAAVAVETAAAPAAPVNVAIAAPPVASDMPASQAVAEPPAPAVPAPPAAPAPAVAPAPAAPAAGKLPTDSKPKLVVLRGQKINAEFPIYEGLNFIGRADEKPVDIDLEDQEPPDRIWCSRQHALISFEESSLTIEDLNSANGTYVNRARIYPGQKRPLNVGDVIQIGTVQLKVRV